MWIRILHRITVEKLCDINKLVFELDSTENFSTFVSCLWSTNSGDLFNDICCFARPPAQEFSSWDSHHPWSSVEKHTLMRHIEGVDVSNNIIITVYYRKLMFF